MVRPNWRRFGKEEYRPQDGEKILVSVKTEYNYCDTDFDIYHHSEGKDYLESGRKFVLKPSEAEVGDVVAWDVKPGYGYSEEEMNYEMLEDALRLKHGEYWAAYMYKIAENFWTNYKYDEGDGSIHFGRYVTDRVSGSLLCLPVEEYLKYFADYLHTEQGYYDMVDYFGGRVLN